MLGDRFRSPRDETATLATSAARVEANRRNAQLSTGPRTSEGKAISRRNSLKHGLTGEGIVVPDEDAEAISRRFAVLEDEMRPNRVMSLILIQRIALFSIRLERSARQEAAYIGEAMRNASDDFDDRRLAEVEKLFDWIASEPATNARRLRRSPEGVERLIKAWLELDADLQRPGLETWCYSHLQLIENLKGRRPADFPLSREAALCKTLWGEAGWLPGEVEGMDAVDRRDYARARLRELVAAHVAELEGLYAKFDLEALAKSRAEAARVALFDSSKEGILARKYEAATERSLLRLMKELREVEAEAASQPDTVAIPEHDEGCGALGSSLGEPDGDPGPMARGSVATLARGSRVVEGARTAPKSRRPGRRPSA